MEKLTSYPAKDRFKYLKSIARLLTEKWGAKTNYQAEEVLFACRENKTLSQISDQYALAVFCFSEAFHQHYDATGDHYSYQKSRKFFLKGIFKSDSDNWMNYKALNRQKGKGRDLSLGEWLLEGLFELPGLLLEMLFGGV